MIEILGLSPGSGSAIQRGEAWEVDVRTQAASLAHVSIALNYAAGGFAELAFAGAPGAASFAPAFGGSAAATVADPGWVRWRFRVSRGTKWFAGFGISVFAVDSAGDLAALSAALVIADAPPPALAFSPAPPLPPALPSAVPCALEFRTQADLLRVLERAFPRDYTDSLKARPGGGWEIFQAAAQVGERVSLAIARLLCCGFVGSATGGAYATGLVEFYREDASAGDYVIAAGTRVRARGGREFRTTAPASLAGLGPVTAPIRAIARGTEWNLEGAVATAGGEMLEGDITEVSRLRADPPTLDIALRARNSAPTAGGAAACLDGLARDLGLRRGAGESDALFRLRIRTTPDTVSPAAICRGVKAIQGFCCLREVGTRKFPGFFYDAGSSADSPQNPANNYAYDFDFAQRPEDRFKLLLSLREFRAFFLVAVPNRIVSQLGLAFDGASTDPFPLRNAFDTPEEDAPAAAFDGETVFDTALSQSVWEIVNEKRAAGVGFDLIASSEGC